MGTTAEKLQAIVNSKSAIKTAINNKGGSITDSTPLDEYATAISNLPSIDSLIDGSITTIDSNATSIRQYAFYFNDTITSVNFPYVETIGTLAFYYASGFTSLNLPNITTLGAQCFQRCSGLLTVSLGPNLTSLGDRIFTQCSSLSSLTLNYNGVVSIQSNSIPINATPVTVYVPSSLISSYQTATNWVDLYNANRVTFSAIPE